MQQKLITMLDMQDAMNSRINPEWRAAGNPWYRAIWTECAEMLDHYGWKWWKKQQADMDQVILEIVDIWHFVLSDYLNRRGLNNSGDVKELAQQLENELRTAQAADDLRGGIEALALSSLQTQKADATVFASLMKSAEMDLEALFRGYAGKNVLNFFRQDHGYNDGSYIKVWAGREDNEHLAEIVTRLDSNSESFRDDLYHALEAVYPKG